MCVDGRSDEHHGGYDIVPDGDSDGCSSGRWRGSFGDEPGRGSVAFYIFLDYFLYVCLDVRNAMLIRNMGLELVFGVED